MLKLSVLKDFLSSIEKKVSELAWSLDTRSPCQNGAGDANPSGPRGSVSAQWGGPGLRGCVAVSPCPVLPPG